jgi:nicotinamidase-related amidase
LDTHISLIRCGRSWYYLRNNGIFDIYPVGFSLHQSVESSMRNAHDLGYRTNVTYEASASYLRNLRSDGSIRESGRH